MRALPSPYQTYSVSSPVPSLQTHPHRGRNALNVRGGGEGVLRILNGGGDGRNFSGGGGGGLSFSILGFFEKDNLEWASEISK